MFSWDTRKALKNYEKHGVLFEEAATIFGDPEALDWEDLEHLAAEQRWKRLGFSGGRPRSSGRICVAEVEEWHGNDSHHQRAQSEPQRTASLRPITVSIFPIFRSQRMRN